MCQLVCDVWDGGAPVNQVGSTARRVTVPAVTMRGIITPSLLPSVVVDEDGVGVVDEDGVGVVDDVDDVGVVDEVDDDDG